MSTLRQIHRFMSDRQRVRLDDGRVGRIVRVDTLFPENDTTVSVWTQDTVGPGVAKVPLDRVVGAEERGTG